jgi:hypothetical protein
MQADNSEDQVKPSAQDQISHCRGGECQQLERMEIEQGDEPVPRRNPPPQHRGEQSSRHHRSRHSFRTARCWSVEQEHRTASRSGEEGRGV